MNAFLSLLLSPFLSWYPLLMKTSHPSPQQQCWPVARIVLGLMLSLSLTFAQADSQPSSAPEDSRILSRISLEVSPEGVVNHQGLVLLLHAPVDSEALLQEVTLDGQALERPVRLLQRSDQSLLRFDLPAHGGVLQLALLSDEPLQISPESLSLLALRGDPETLFTSGEAELLRGSEDSLLLWRDMPVLSDTVSLERPRMPAMILSPLPHAHFRDSDAIAVVLQAPLGSQLRLLVNERMILEERIGERVFDEEQQIQRYSYVGVPLQAGNNLLRLEAITPEGERLEDSLEVSFAGAAATISWQPRMPLRAGSARDIEFDLRVRDAWDNIPRDGFISLELEDGEFASPDANPQQLGYQVRIENGRGRVALRPVAQPKIVTLRAQLGEDILEERLSFRSELRPWIATGIGRAALSFPSGGPRFDLSAEVFARGTVFEHYLLTLAANAPFERLGLLGDPYETFPVHGASGELRQEPRSRDGVYVRLERDLNFVQYGDLDSRDSLDRLLLRLDRDLTGLSGSYQPLGAGLYARGYAALQGLGQEVRDLEIPSDGTSFYRLPNRPIARGSLRARVIKRSAFDSSLIETGDPLLGSLQALRDFSVDEASGTLQLARALPTRDAEGNRYLLQLSYRLEEESDAPRRLQFGAQLGYSSALNRVPDSEIDVYIGAYQETRNRDEVVRVVSLGSHTVVPLAAGELDARLELAYGQSSQADQGGWAIASEAAYAQEGWELRARYQFVSDSYQSSQRERSGHSLELEADAELSRNLGLEADARVRSDSQGTESEAEARALLQTGRLGDIADSELRFGLGFENRLQQDIAWRALAGVSLRELFGLRAARFDLEHRQSLVSHASSISDIRLSLPLIANLNLDLINELEWGQQNRLLVGLSSTLQHSDIFGLSAADFGSTRLQARYELSGGLSDEAGRLRVGLSSSYPVRPGLSLEAGLEQNLRLHGNDDRSNETILRSGLRFDHDDWDSSARYELRLADNTKHVVTAGVNAAIDDNFFVSATLNYSHDNQGDPRSGLRFSIASAYRSAAFDLLSHHQADFGLFDPEGEEGFKGDFRLLIPLELGGEFLRDWQLQLGYIQRSSRALGYRDMINLGLSAGLWPHGRLTLLGSLFQDYPRNNRSLGLTIELSQAIACGGYGVIAYSTGGVSDPMFGHRGLQVRLELIADEQWRCGRGYISGHIRDPQDNDQAGVAVHLYRPDGQLVDSRHSDKHGRFRFDNPAPESYYLQLVSPEHSQFSGHNEDEDIVINPDTGRSDVFRVGRSGSQRQFSITAQPRTSEAQP